MTEQIGQRNSFPETVARGGSSRRVTRTLQDCLDLSGRRLEKIGEAQFAVSSYPSFDLEPPILQRNVGFAEVIAHKKQFGGRYGARNRFERIRKILRFVAGSRE